MKSIVNLGRAPVPEWEEVARAARPQGLVPASWTRWVGASFWWLYPATMVALLVCALLRLSWLGLGVLAVSAVADWLASRADAPSCRLADFLGLRAPLRALLRSILAALLVAGTAPTAWGPLGAYVVGVLVLQGAWLVQGGLGGLDLAGFPAPTLRPGGAATRWRLRPPRAGPGPSGGHAGTYVAIEGLAVATALIGTGSWWAPPLIVLVFASLIVHTVISLSDARGLAQSRVSAEQTLLGTLSQAGPRYLVYVSLGARQSKYIVNQWSPVLDAVDQTGIMVVREASNLAPLAPTRLPVIYAPSPRHVERLIIPSIKVAFYLAYGEKNGQLLREPSIKHVMLMHGDSDKATSANALARAFDEIWVAGPAAVDRYVEAGIGIAPERFAIVGRPQIERLSVGPRGVGPRTILYAPTFEGYYDETSHSSLEVMGPALIRRILADLPDVVVWFKPHPASGVQRPGMLTAISQISTLLRSSPGAHVVVDDDPRLTLLDCLQAADVLVSDISSVATDFLYTERPIVTCNPSDLSTGGLPGPLSHTTRFLHPRPDAGGLRPRDGRRTGR